MLESDTRQQRMQVLRALEVVWWWPMTGFRHWNRKYGCWWCWRLKHAFNSLRVRMFTLFIDSLKLHHLVLVVLLSYLAYLTISTYYFATILRPKDSGFNFFNQNWEKTNCKILLRPFSGKHFVHQHILSLKHEFSWIFHTITLHR